jgi:hypothetical protein
VRDGDLVRFRHELTSKRRRDDCGIWEWKLGFLVKYRKWEKIATILCDGKIYRIRAGDVQKAGKKDMLNEGQ